MREAIFLIALGSVNGGMALRMVEPMLPRLADDFGISVAAAASVITAFGIGYAAGQLMHGPLGDRFGKLRVVTLALAGAALGSFGCALAQGAASLAALRFLAALFASASTSLGVAFIGDHVPVAERQPVIARFIGGTIIGQALGPMVGGWFTDLLGWRGTFVVMGAVFAIVAALLLYRTRLQWSQFVRHADSGNPFTAYVRVFALPRVRRVCGAAFFDGFFFFGAYSFLGAYLRIRFGLSLSAIGTLLAGFGVGGLLYTVCVKRLLALLGQRIMVASGAAACCAAYAVVAFSPWWQVAIPGTVALGFTFFMLHNTVQMRATEMAPQARGAAVSAFAATWSLGQAAGVAAMGITVTLLDYPLAITAFGAGFLALGLWMRASLDRL